MGREAAEAPDRGDGGFKSTEVGEPIKLKKRKGGRLRKNERMLVVVIVILQMLWSLTILTLNHSTCQ